MILILKDATFKQACCDSNFVDFNHNHCDIPNSNCLLRARRSKHREPFPFGSLALISQAVYTPWVSGIAKSVASVISATTEFIRNKLKSEDSEFISD